MVTGAFSYTGSAVARELQRRGFSLFTLTNRRPPKNGTIPAAPLRFDADHLTRELSDTSVLVNTYWVRLPYANESFSTAVENSRILIEAAKRAGVRRLVHISVSNAARGTNLGYYSGKAQVENLVRQSGLSYAIVRPTLIVGPTDVLTNNIAWFLRHSPLFLMPGSGAYRLQPVTLNDTARIVADAVEGEEDIEVDAAGPDILTFREYVRMVAVACGIRRWIAGTPVWMALAALRLAGFVLRDIVLTKEELQGLQQELLVSQEPPLGQESVREFLQVHGGQLGRRYINDLHRHFGAGTTESVLAASSNDILPTDALREFPET